MSQSQISQVKRQEEPLHASQSERRGNPFFDSDDVSASICGERVGTKTYVGLLVGLFLGLALVLSQPVPWLPSFLDALVAFVPPRLALRGTFRKAQVARIRLVSVVLDSPCTLAFPPREWKHPLSDARDQLLFWGSAWNPNGGQLLLIEVE